MEPIAISQFKFYVIVILTITISYACSSKREFSANTEDYTVALDIAENGNSLTRESTVSEADFAFENYPIGDVIAYLLDINKENIFFDESAKKDLIITADYRNLRAETSLEQSKQDLLEFMKEKMDFNIERAFPENTFCLTVQNEDFLSNNIVVETGASSSKVSTNTLNKELSFSSAKLSQIVQALNEVYEVNFVVEKEQNHLHYTFELEGVELENLNNYLEEKMGFTLIKSSEDNFPPSIEKYAYISFN